MSPTRDLNNTETTELAGGIAALTVSRRPLPSGLRALADEASPRVAAPLRRLAAEIESGRSFEDALAAPGIGLPTHVVALLEAGRRSGDLVSPLAGALGEASLGAELRRRIRLGLVYPFVMFGSGLVLLSLLYGVVFAQTQEVFADFGVSLPWISAVILALGARLGEGGGWILLALVGAVLVTTLMARLLFTPAERRRLVLSVPVIGPVARYASIASFCRLLAGMLDSRLPLPEALRLAGAAADDPVLASSCDEAAIRVEAGADLGVIASDGLFPPGFDAFARWAQRSEEPASTFRLAGEIFEARARNQAAHASAFLKVLAMVTVGWWALIAIVAVVVPFLTLLGSLM